MINQGYLGDIQYTLLDKTMRYNFLLSDVTMVRYHDDRRLSFKFSSWLSSLLVI
jgi:hypothetical protein